MYYKWKKKICRSMNIHMFTSHFYPDVHQLKLRRQACTLEKYMKNTQLNPHVTLWKRTPCR